MDKGLNVLLLSILLSASCGTPPAPEEHTTNATTDTIAAAPPAPVSARPVHWGYEGDVGPATWSSLSPVYALCGGGKGQSPIALTSNKAGGEVKWSFNYGNTLLKVAHNEHVDELVDNGHTIQVTVEEGSTVTLDGKTYTLKQFHFHTPSEHTLDGVNVPMEMHLVHQDAAGDFAVVSVLIKEGKPNANFAKLVANLPAAKGDTVVVADHRLDLKTHLPAQEKAFHYVGSLTTPPCSENVQWLVLQDMLTLSKEQIAAFSSRIGANNRPVQALNERGVSNVLLTGSAK